MGFEILLKTATHTVHWTDDNGVGVTEYTFDDLETRYPNLTKQQTMFLINNYGDKAVNVIWNAV